MPLSLQRKSSCNTTASSSSDEESWHTKHYLSGLWCPTCEAFHLNCQKLAAGANFKLLGSLYSTDLAFKCPQKHLIKINRKSRAQPNIKSCADCRKAEREAQKEKIRLEEQEQQAYYAEMQERLFQKAKHDMEEEMRRTQQQTHSTFSCGSSYSYGSQYASANQGYFEADHAARQQAVEANINKVASEQTRAYLGAPSPSEGPEPVKEQVFLVYKFLNTPVEVLVSGLR